jgi:DNA-binding transcriptional ArsR family regulator
MSQQTIFDIQAGLCQAMASPLRIEIMHLLRDGPLSVTDIASAANNSPATISRNLTTLRNAGIVDAHREGSRIFYHIANPQTHERVRPDA